MPIRIATSVTDAKSASRVHAAGWKAGYGGIFSEEALKALPLDYWEKGILSNYSTHRFQCALLSVDGMDVGAGIFGYSRTYDIKYGEILSLYFLPEAWGKGFSTKLLNFICGQLGAMGCACAHLWVLEDCGRARRFYEKNGFTLTDNYTTSAFNDEPRRCVEYMKFFTSDAKSGGENKDGLFSK